MTMTRRECSQDIWEAAALEIRVLDHLIVTSDQVISMAELGLLYSLEGELKRAAEASEDRLK